MSKAVPWWVLQFLRLRLEKLCPQTKAGKLSRLLVWGDDVATTSWVYAQVEGFRQGHRQLGTSGEETVIATKNPELDFWCFPFVCIVSEWVRFGKTGMEVYVLYRGKLEVPNEQLALFLTCCGIGLIKCRLIGRKYRQDNQMRRILRRIKSET